MNERMTIAKVMGRLKRSRPTIYSYIKDGSLTVLTGDDGLQYFVTAEVDALKDSLRANGKGGRPKKWA
jgi:predicted DNA-binding transcriptional regulator AlpA